MEPETEGKLDDDKPEISEDKGPAIVIKTRKVPPRAFQIRKDDMMRRSTVTPEVVRDVRAGSGAWAVNRTRPHAEKGSRSC